MHKSFYKKNNNTSKNNNNFSNLMNKYLINKHISKIATNKKFKYNQINFNKVV